jgi:hypothetical protein
MESCKSQRPKQWGKKFSLSAFLQLEVPVGARVIGPVPRLASLPAEQKERNFSIYALSTTPDYRRDNPTPFEAYACKAFGGLCLECQMVFATWKHPEDGMPPCRKIKNAHHNFGELERCWCPLCRMLLGDLLRYDEVALQELRRAPNSTTNSDVRVFHHRRYVPCYYVELSFEFDNRRLRPFFMMFIDGESHPFLSSMYTTNSSQEGNVPALARLYCRLQIPGTYGVLPTNGSMNVKIGMETVQYHMSSRHYRHGYLMLAQTTKRFGWSRHIHCYLAHNTPHCLIAGA